MLKKKQSYSMTQYLNSTVDFDYLTVLTVLVIMTRLSSHSDSKIYEK